MPKGIITQLQNAADKGRKEGILLGIDIAAIAIDEVFGEKWDLKAEDYQQLDAKVQELLNEIQNYKDMEKLAAHIAKRLMQIRTDDPGYFLEKYIKL